MQILRDGIDRVPVGVRTAVSIGAYDGIHRGHQTVLSTVVSEARSSGLAPAVVTFDQHPASIVRPEGAPLLLTSHEQRVELFAGLGVEYLYLLDFDQQRSETTDHEFVADVLVDRMAAAKIVVGSDFHFGKGRAGSVETLAAMGADNDFAVVGLDLLVGGRASGHASTPISSTAIRQALTEGDIAAVKRMLGRRFEIRGTVVEGDKRGRTIGFPTANIAYQPGYAWPSVGVYAAMVTVSDGAVHPAAVNIGLRPTFHESADAPVLEAHLLDVELDLYGREISVAFESFLRPERRFDGIDEIRTQLALDIESARDALAELQ